MNAPEKALIPSLRFPEFSGEWEEKRLGELAIFASGGTPSKKKDEYWSGHIPWISASSMHSDVIDRSELMVTDLGAQNGTKLAATGALLLLVRGSMLFNRIPAGICARDVVFNQDVKLLIASPETTEHFILLQIRSKEHRLLSLVVGTGIGAGKIDTSELEIFSMPIPPLPEQLKISDYLGAVDAKLRLLERRRDALTAYKKGMMQRIFVKEIRFTQEDGTAFPDWQEKRLGDVANIRTGKLDANAMREDGEYRFYTCAKEFYRIDSYAFDTEALIVSGNGANVGYIHYFKGKFNAYQRTYVIDCVSENILFVEQFLREHLGRRIEIEKKAGNTPYIVMGTLADMLISSPIDPDEQQKIADFLRAIDDKITAATRRITAMQDFKKSMLQQMFV